MFLGDGAIEVQYIKGGKYLLRDILSLDAIEFTLSDIDYICGRETIPYYCQVNYIGNGLVTVTDKKSSIFLTETEFDILKAYLR